MQTTRTLTVNDLLEALYRVPRHTPVVIKATIDDAGSECSEQSCPSPCYHGTLSLEGITTQINCVELHACE